MPENKVARTELTLTLARICPAYVGVAFSNFQEGEYWESWQVDLTIGTFKLAELQVGWSSATLGAFIQQGDKQQSLTRSVLEQVICEKHRTSDSR